MSVKAPLVSVIIPVFNGERFLGAALASVLAQDYRPFEIIVVDDGSEDASAAIARSCRGVHYRRQPNQGVAAARNAGLAASSGGLVAFLDQDDAWTPDKLTVQVGHLRRHPEIGYVLARQRIFLEPGTAVPSWLRSRLLGRDAVGFLPGTLLARAEVFDRVGPFDPGFRSGDDSDWFARAKDAKVPMDVLPEVLLLRRIHDRNLSAQVSLAHAELLKAMRGSVGRQRRKEG